jgi:hypothetical protein
MNWRNWAIVSLVTLNAGWMLADGTRALIVGDYVTPQTGEYAGQLGPWSNLVKAVGIEPRSTAMKVIFVTYGLLTLTTTIGYVFQQAAAQKSLIFAALLGLWYLPIGTAANLIALILLFATRR